MKLHDGDCDKSHSGEGEKMDMVVVMKTKTKARGTSVLCCVVKELVCGGRWREVNNAIGAGVGFVMVGGSNIWQGM